MANCRVFKHLSKASYSILKALRNKYFVKVLRALFLYYQKYPSYICLARIYLRPWLFEKVGDRCSLGCGVKVSGNVKIFLGDGVAIRDNVFIGGNGTLHIGENVAINNGTIIACYGDMTIGSNTMIAPMSYILDIDHEYASLDMPMAKQGYRISPVVIGEDVWIGAQSIISKGVKIGDGVIVSANSFVNQDISSYSVVFGTPARVITNRKKLAEHKDSVEKEVN